MIQEQGGTGTVTANTLAIGPLGMGLGAKAVTVSNQALRFE